MSVSHDTVRDFLYREARYLDDKDWDSWLELYAPRRDLLDAVLGRQRRAHRRPAAGDLADLVRQPLRPGRPGVRIKTERSSASIPDTRTSHNLSNIEVLEQVDGLCQVRFNWHTLSFRYKTVDSYFGTSFYTLDVRGENPLIRAKKVILKNDYVRQVVDVYHL